MQPSSDGLKKKDPQSSPGPTSFSPFADLRSPCPSCGRERGLLLAWASSDLSQSGSSPSPPVASQGSCATASDSSSPSSPDSQQNGCGPSSSSPGSGQLITQPIKKVGDFLSGLQGKLRCNTCSRLFTKRNTAGTGNCKCGTRAWYLSRVTIPERIGFWLGYHVDSPGGLQEVNALLGGRVEKVNQSWTKIEEERKNGIESTR